MHTGRLPLLLVFFPVLSNICFGQSTDSIFSQDVQRVEAHIKKTPATLFAHLDKELYTPEDLVMFTAYITGKGGDSLEAGSVYAAIIDPATGKLISSDRFYMGGGICTGSLILPDTVANGQYEFIAYTDRMFESSRIAPYRQLINFRGLYKNWFRFSSHTVLRDSTKRDSVIWHARIVTDSNRLAAGGNFDYMIRANGKTLREGTKIIDPFGEVDITLPASDTLLDNVYVSAAVSRGDQSNKLSMPIDLSPQRIMVGYAPEGGHLVDGLASAMALTFRRNNGQSVRCSGILVEDTTEEAEFETDPYGYATLTFRPQKGKRYWLRMNQLPPGTYLSGDFPAIETEGLSLRLAGGVVQDTLSLTVESTPKYDKCRLLIYSQEQMIFGGSISLKNRWVYTKIPVSGWPRGLARIVLLSDNNVSLAERTIYLPTPPITASIKLDSAQYHHRSKVQGKVTLADATGRPVRGFFSFGATAASRAHSLLMPDITMPALFHPILDETVAYQPPPAYLTDSNKLDNVLLTRFAKYIPWQEVWADSLTNKPSHRNPVFGMVSYNDKKLKRPVEISVMGGGPLTTLYTDSSGRFEIADSALISRPGEKPRIVVMGKYGQDGYEVRFENNYDTLTAQLASELPTLAALKPDNQESSLPANTNPFDSVKTLKPVEVIAGRDEDVKVTGHGPCRDWVCSNKVLNCTNHRTQISPELGERYLYFGRVKGLLSDGTLIYRGCVSCTGCYVGKPPIAMPALPCIHVPTEASNTDSLALKSPEIVTFSTVAWKPVSLTNKEGEAEFSFFTNDADGRMYGSLQGWAPGAGTFRAQIFFRVVTGTK